jgi:hypothetical protein
MLSFVIAGLLGAGILALVFWMRSKDIKATWYEWIIGIVGFLMLLFTFQNFFASYAEAESGAAIMFLPVLGLPALILLGVAWQLVARRQRAG